MIRHFITYFIFFLISKASVFAQQATITGPLTVAPGQTVSYTINFPADPSPFIQYTTVSWFVTGGHFDPVPGDHDLTVMIVWDNAPATGQIEVYENWYGQTAVFDVTIDNFPLSGGTIASTGSFFNGQSTPLISSQAPATGGSCAVASTYFYNWEYRLENSISWQVFGTGEQFPAGGFTFTDNTRIRRRAECSGVTAFSNELIFQYEPAGLQNMHLVRENSVLKKGVKSYAAADMLPIGSKAEATGYFDILGRPVQSNLRAVTPLGKDMISYPHFDLFWRNNQSPMPYVSQQADGRYHDLAEAEQLIYYSSNPDYANESNFYSETIFDNSPLSKVTKVLPPGKNWAGSNKGSTVQQFVNTVTDKVPIIKVNTLPGSMPTVTGFYLPGTLVKTIAANENGVQVITFNDRGGRSILKKIQHTAASDNGSGSGLTNWICTYNIYDDFGRIRVVLPPLAVKELDATPNMMAFNFSQLFLENLCFSYDYDEKDRLIYKKEPGGTGIGFAEYVYDSKNRLVLSRNANQANGYNLPGKQWSFILYDDKSRQVTAGQFVNNSTRAQMQSFVNSLNNGLTAVTINTGAAEILKCDNPVIGSASGCNACTAIEINSVAYYDKYSYPGVLSFSSSYNLAYTPDDFVEPTAASGRVTGLVTGAKVRVLDNGNTFLVTTTYYDEKGRPVQTLTKNLNGGTDVATSQYSFSGLVMSTYLQHSNPASITDPATTVRTKYMYDNASRLLKVFKKVNNGAEKEITSRQYNELGQVASKQIAPYINLAARKYSYSIRGWMSAVNKDFLTAPAPGNSNAYFGFAMGFDEPGNLFTGSNLTGKMAGISWRSTGDNAQRKYDFTYDNAQRLTHADFKQNNAAGWTNAPVDYSVAVGQYDANGNIKTISQKGFLLNSSTEIDKLTYDYYDNGNRLKAVTQDGFSTADYKLDDFVDKNTGAGSVDYDYDFNGNMVADRNKNFTVKYNALNLPAEVTAPGKGSIKFIYDASGAKWRKIVNDLTDPAAPGGKTITTDYLNGFVYQGNELQEFGHEQGRVRNSLQAQPCVQGVTRNLVFDYFLTDHLGNIRSVITDEQNSVTYAATFEQANRNCEQLFYADLPATPADDPKPIGFDADANNQQVIRFNGSEQNKRVGATLILKVMAGDKIKPYCFAWHQAGIDVNKELGWPSITSTLISILNGGIPGNSGGKVSAADLNSSGVTSGAVNNFFNFQNTSSDPARAKAYLNWILLDEQEFKPVYDDNNTNFQQVPAFTAGNSKKLLEITSNSGYINIKKNGYLFIYLSNESKGNVYFDDVRVIHERGPLIEENAYYPFGLTMKNISSKALARVGTAWKFNGKEINNREFYDGTGLEWYNYGFRDYDPQIGRFFAIDPLASSFQALTPYQYASNDPVNNLDIDGLEGSPWNYVFNASGLSSYQSSYGNGAAASKALVADLASELGNPKTWGKAIQDMGDALGAPAGMFVLGEMMGAGAGLSALRSARFRKIASSADVSISSGARALLNTDENALAFAARQAGVRGSTIDQGIDLLRSERLLQAEAKFLASDAGIANAISRGWTTEQYGYAFDAIAMRRGALQRQSMELAMSEGNWQLGQYHFQQSTTQLNGFITEASNSASALVSAAEGGGRIRVAFGFKEEAIKLADEIGGIHLMKDPNWKSSALEIFNNSRYEVHFSLNGIDETPMNMINSPLRSSTNWEMHNLYQSPAFESATFYHGQNIYIGFGVFKIKI